MFRTAPQPCSDRVVFPPGMGVVARVVSVVTICCATLAGGTGCANDARVLAQADQAHGELNKAVVTDPMMADYIQEVGDRIVSTAARLHETGYRPKKKSGEESDWMFSDAMRFHFVNSKTLNAFTTGGEHMYLYTELLRRSRNEGEMAAVMAHEYAHVYGRHVQNGMNRQMVAMLGAGGAAAAGYVAGGSEKGGQYAGYGAGLGMLAAGLVNAGFTRSDEAEADKIGFDVFVRAGYHPDDFAGFFRTILEEEKKGGGGAQPEFMSDHPSTPNRIAAAEKWADTYKAEHPDWKQRLRRPVASESEFRRIQQRSVEIARSMPDDKTLAGSALMAALPRSCMFPDEPHPPEAKRAQQYLMQRAEQQQGQAQPAQQQPRQRRRD